MPSGYCEGAGVPVKRDHRDVILLAEVVRFGCDLRGGELAHLRCPIKAEELARAGTCFDDAIREQGQARRSGQDEGRLAVGDRR